jgi:hypothetical protein
VEEIEEIPRVKAFIWSSSATATCFIGFVSNVFQFIPIEINWFLHDTTKLVCRIEEDQEVSLKVVLEEVQQVGCGSDINKYQETPPEPPPSLTVIV